MGILKIIRVMKNNGSPTPIFKTDYDVPIAVYSTAKLMRKHGLKIEKKDKNMLFATKLLVG